MPSNHPVDPGRRRWLRAAAACGALCVGGPLRAQAPVARPVLADMHSHYDMFRPRLLGPDLGRHLRDTGVTLVAWAIADDGPWIGWRTRAIEQVRTPREGELWSFFQGRMKARHAELERAGLKMALVPADVDAAAAGDPRVVLASEAANFLEGDVSRLAIAHAGGLRHTQIVHYIASPLGDFQTAEPKHGGLTPLGMQVVRECRRLGIVVDLAHGTPALVDAALDASDVPMVWSHSWIHPEGGPWHADGYFARSLPLATAKKIAARGGVVGLWTVRARLDRRYPLRDARSYADEIVRMMDLVGPEHVAFGTDMDGAGSDPVLRDYTDLREVADDLARRNLPDAALRGVLFDNYARVLRQAMVAAAPARRP